MDNRRHGSEEDSISKQNTHSPQRVVESRLNPLQHPRGAFAEAQLYYNFAGF